MLNYLNQIESDRINGTTQLKGDEMENLEIKSELNSFELVNKEYSESKGAYLYSFKHTKTGTELFYFDREDENKTFAICFKTLPENSTGVFHILEHTVLNGSEKYPVKEPMMAMMQGSMQTFLNAMTFSDKTLFPVSSRNEKDFLNLMSVYLDAVFNPLIYKRPEIFMQEGWHYEFDEEGIPYYNGVVYNEMKGVYSDVDSLMTEYISAMLYPDTSYGYSSGGNPENITELTYQEFVETHKRFYHPSNAKIILDGHMNLNRVLEYIDEEYMSKYSYKEMDFDFKYQKYKPTSKTIYYQSDSEDKGQAHMVATKIICNHNDVDMIYGAKVLEDYLAGSNEAPLKRTFLEKEIAQDVNIMVEDGVLQPNFSVVVRNVKNDDFDTAKQCLKECMDKIISEGLDKKALLAAIERMDFEGKEVKEPYGVEVVMKLMDGCLYGDEPLTHVDTDSIYERLRQGVESGYFEKLLADILDGEDLSYLYAYPSTKKMIEDEEREYKKIETIVSDWTKDDMEDAKERFVCMQQWQQEMDDEEAMMSLPHLDIADINVDENRIRTDRLLHNDTEILHVITNTNGIVYVNMYFDVSDFELEELRLLNLLTSFFGEWNTINYNTKALQTAIKNTLGNVSARMDVLGKPGINDECKTYLVVSTSMLEKNIENGLDLIKEILLNSRLNDGDRIYENILQDEYYIKQSIISEGHMFAIKKALSAYTAEDNLKELLEGESFAGWMAGLVSKFSERKGYYTDILGKLLERAFSKNRLFIGYSGNVDENVFDKLIDSLPINTMGQAMKVSRAGEGKCNISINSSVGFSAIGGNVYKLGTKYTGAYQVLSSLISFGYLWNEVRVQGGAYGTGMATRLNGDLFCYSYRDPNLDNTENVYKSIPEFLEGFLEQEVCLDDIIIGALNSFDPLMEPEAICNMECIQYLKGITADDIVRVKKEILETDTRDLKKMLKVIDKFAREGKICKVVLSKRS